MADVGRVYAGRSEFERRADRRGRLVTSGLALFGTEGYAAVTIERLCGHAGVATRSFYEEFSGREQLLGAVYAEVVAGSRQAVLTAVASAPDLPGRVRAGVAAYVGYLTEDPRRAQVAHREVRRVEQLEARRLAVIVEFAGLIAGQVELRPPGGDVQHGRVLALALAGAAGEVLVDWVSAGSPRPPTAPVVSGLTRIYLAALTAGDE